jgi:5'-nucleotidase
MKILISNDDGIYAEGIHALEKELRKLGQVWVVAPLEEKSTTGHSLTLHKPLRLLRVKDRFFGVTGSPADCVYMGVREVIGELPDLVVSGINRGANLGQDVYYSGTVSAAREAAILGIPSLAVSLAVNFMTPKPDAELHYATAARWAREVLKKDVFRTMPKNTLLNLNLPDLPYSKVKGLQITRQGFRYYGSGILRRKDHRGRDYYWIGGTYKGFKSEPGSDCDAVDHGYASLTPLQLDSTDSAHFQHLSSQAVSVGYRPSGRRRKP